VQAAREIGVRIVASRGSMDLGVSDGGLPPDELVEDIDAVLADTERLVDELHEPGPGARAQIAVAPCSPFSVTKRLMAESAELARRWFARQPEGVTVYRDAAGEVTGFSCFVQLRPEERAWAEEDPCAAAVWRFLDTEPPLEPGQIVALSRFWMDRDAYQMISPTQGMIFVASIRYVLTTPGLAYSFHAFAHADLYAPMAGQVLISRLPQGDFSVGRHRCGMFYYDWRALPPQAWVEALAERETA